MRVKSDSRILLNDTSGSMVNHLKEYSHISGLRIITARYKAPDKNGVSTLESSPGYKKAGYLLCRSLSLLLGLTGWGGASPAQVDIDCKEQCSPLRCRLQGGSGGILGARIPG